MMVRTKQLTLQLAALAFALVLAFVLAWAPPAQADETQENEIYVGDVLVTDANAADVLGDGTVSFDAATNTLTLNGATIEVAKHFVPGVLPTYDKNVSTGIYVVTDDDFTVKLVGENKITYDGHDLGADPYVTGLLATCTQYPKTFTLTGEGSLDIDLAGLPGFAEEFAATDFSVPVDTDLLSSISGIRPGFTNVVFDGGCDVSIAIGDGDTPAAYMLYGISGANLFFEDCTVDCAIAVGRVSEALGSGSTSMGEGSVFTYKSAEGSYEAYGYSGGPLTMTGDAKTRFDVGLALRTCSATQGAGMTISDNATLEGYAGLGHQFVVGDGMRPGNGFAGGPVVVKDNATLVLAGSYCAVAGAGVDLSEHAVGGVAVSSGNDELPTDAAKWDRTSNLSIADTNPYRFVRVSNVEDESADIIAAGKVLDMIEALPEAEDAAGEADHDATLEAKNEYDALTDEQKALMPAHALDKLDAVLDAVLVKYDVWVAGIQATELNAPNMFGDGTVAYDPHAHILTLENATIPVVTSPNITYTARAMGIYELVYEPVTIVLKGENRIICAMEHLDLPAGVTQSSLEIDGIYSGYASVPEGAAPLDQKTPALSITGDGSLTFDFAMANPKVPDVAGRRPSISFNGFSSGQLVNIKADINYVSGDPDVMLEHSTSSVLSGVNFVIDGDAFVDVSIGKHSDRVTYMGAGQSTLGGNAVVDVEFADGSDDICGGSGGLNLIKDNATLNVHAGKGVSRSCGYSCGYFHVQDNATVTLVSDGIIEPAANRYAAGLNCGEFKASGNSTITLVGPAALWAPEPNLSGHAVGGAVVSQTQSILPADAVLWDGAVPLNKMDGPEGYYRYIRIPGTADAAADIVAAGAVLDMIEALPEPKDATEDDKEAVEKAWEAFENLTDDQELLLPEEAVEKLATLYDELRDPEVVRIAGDYANETAAAISAYAFPEGSEYVVIARDDDFADALGATGLAGALNCPIVLTDREALSEAAAEEIERLGAKSALVIGGTGAIKPQVDEDLKALGVEVGDRVWGENGYDTSLECAKRIAEITGSKNIVVVAMSTNFQDALSISPVAYREKLPLVLQTWGDTSADRGFTDEAREFLAGTRPIVAGGQGAVSDASFEGIELAVEPFHLWGETGYDTSNAIAEWATDIERGLLDDRAAVFACGAQAPKGVDALAGSALAGRLGCPILLVNGNEEMEAVDTTTVGNYFADHAANCKDVYILGGEYVMPPSLVEKIESLLG